MKCQIVFVILAVAGFVPLPCHADIFGTGGNAFDIPFVTIGNPGNAADTTGSPNPAGSVPYSYRIGEYEISSQMIDKANTLGDLGITKDIRPANKPATSVSWNEAARFVNWLNTSTGSPPAYKFDFPPGDPSYISNDNIQLWTPSDAGYNPNNLYRNSLARYFLPSVDEWYKAAYYDATNGVYYDYATGSNTAPTPVANGTAAGTAVYNNQPGGSADITLAGGLSPYGTMGQTGNVYEWDESDYDQMYGPGESNRGTRGGGWTSTIGAEMSSSHRISTNPAFQNASALGFRVASIPEPSTSVLSLMGVAAFGLFARHYYRNATSCADLSFGAPRHVVPLGGTIKDTSIR